MSERVNARLKDEFGGSQLRVRGAAKVMAHLMFGVLALTVDRLLRFGSLIQTEKTAENSTTICGAFDSICHNGHFLTLIHPPPILFACRGHSGPVFIACQGGLAGLMQVVHKKSNFISALIPIISTK